MMESRKIAPVLIAGEWREAAAVDSFAAVNPATGEALDRHFPVSDWSDVDAALSAAAVAFDVMQTLPAQRIAEFLRAYADRLEAEADPICSAAAEETGYDVTPRLRDVEMVRTIKQLRLAADATEHQTWCSPVIDREANLASVLEPLGPTAVFGPNNFPLAYNSISGGDFASAIAAGNPVIAKAHPNHPHTSKLLAQCAQRAVEQTHMPLGMVQMLYGLRREDGLRLVADARLGAVGFTGSRAAGLALKGAADAVGKPIFLEMSSVNPVVILPGALAERAGDVVNDLVTSALLGTGQFCTNPGLVFVAQGEHTDAFLSALAERYRAAPCGNLLSSSTQQNLIEGIDALVKAGASVVVGHEDPVRPGFAWANTLLRVSGEHFHRHPAALQTEAFGNATLVVVADAAVDLPRLLAHCEGSLTGSIYSATDGSEDAAYAEVARVLRPRVGRLLNDKMPTGVAVSPAMNHGGPFPATGHPHFTAVGMPAAIRRFTRLACYDHVRPHRLPAILRDVAATPVH